VQCKNFLLTFFVQCIYIASRSQQSRQPGFEKRAHMLKGFEEFQKVGKDGFDAAVRSFGEMNKGFQAIAAEVTDYSKKAFEDSTRAFEQLIGAKSIEQAIEIQSQYAKKAYDTYVAEMSKLGEMYVGLAKDAYKPVEAAFTKKVV
jgi:phasin family protein